MPMTVSSVSVKREQVHEGITYENAIVRVLQFALLELMMKSVSTFTDFRVDVTLLPGASF